MNTEEKINWVGRKLVRFLDQKFIPMSAMEDVLTKIARKNSEESWDISPGNLVQFLPEEYRKNKDVLKSISDIKEFAEKQSVKVEEKVESSAA